MWLLWACAPHPSGPFAPATLRSEAAFTDAARVAVAEVVAPATVTGEVPMRLVLRGTDDTEVEVDLRRIHTRCVATPSACEAEVAELARIAKETLTLPGAPVDAAQLIEAVRPESYVSALVGTGGRPLATPLVGDLYRVVMIDQPAQTRVATMTDLEGFAMPGADLLARADMNTRGRIGHVRSLVQTLDAGVIGALSGRDAFYASSLLLQTDEWGEVSTLRAGDLVVSVPAHDTLLYAWVTDAAQLDGVKAATAKAYAKAERPISARVFRWQGVWTDAP